MLGSSINCSFVIVVDTNGTCIVEGREMLLAMGANMGYRIIIQCQCKCKTNKLQIVLYNKVRTKK